MLIIASFFALYPVVWVLSAAFNPVDNLSAARLIPRSFTFDNFTELFESDLTPFGTWLFNSWRVALIAASLNVILAALASFAFSRLRFRGRRAGLLSLLLIQVFPQFLGFMRSSCSLNRSAISTRPQDSTRRPTSSWCTSVERLDSTLF